MKFLKSIFAFFASYGLSVVLLLLLMLLVFFGTLEQTRSGLFEVQKRYFESIIVIHWIQGIVPVPLLGGYFLLVLIFINMICGAVVRAPKRWTHPGLLIAHCGVLLLILAGFVANRFAITGNMPLYEGDQSNRFQSYVDWDIRVVEIGGEHSGNQYVMPFEALLHMFAKPANDRLSHPQLPFTVAVEECYVNCRPTLSNAPHAVEGIAFEPLDAERSLELNVPGVCLRLLGTHSEKGLLWGMQRAPWVVSWDGRIFAFYLERRSWALPFSIRLEKFNHERHPGTAMPKHFSSQVVVIDGESTRDALIQMNEPLRHRGYVFYQASYGPTNAQPGDPTYSVLAVVRNPGGDWHIYASCLICFGLCLHYLQVLIHYLKRSGAKRTVSL